MLKEIYGTQFRNAIVFCITVNYNPSSILIVQYAITS